MLRGSYPEWLLDEYVRLIGDSFLRPGDLEVIHADISFLAVNYYTPFRVASVPPRVAPTRARPWGIGSVPKSGPAADVPRTTKDWTIEPDGLTALLLRIRRDYGDIPLYITENGAAFYDYVDPGGTVHNPERIDYLKRLFAAAHAAIAQGVNLRGYFVWSFLDNFKSADGYGQRFGIVFTDYRTQERIPKESARWYREVIAANAVESLRGRRLPGRDRRRRLPPGGRAPGPAKPAPRSPRPSRSILRVRGGGGCLRPLVPSTSSQRTRPLEPFSCCTLIS